MKKILFLALIFALVSCLLTGCDETDGADDANTLPPTQQDNAAGDNDSVSDKTESESSGSGNGSQSGNTDTGGDDADDALVDTNGDGVVDENDRIPDDSTSEKPNGGENTTPPSGSDTPTAPATVEYDQDYRQAESPDDMIFTCMGASNTTLSGSVTISGTYKDRYPVISVWMGAFMGCTDITSVTISEGIAYIYADAFSSCTSMTDIYLPSTLTSIGAEAFAGCTALVNIHFAGTKAQWAAVKTGEKWQPDVAQYVIHCSDGTIVINLK